MKKWAHPLDFVALAAGVYAACSPIWTTTTDKATVAMIVLGIVTAGIALFSLARPGEIAEGLMALMGVLFIASPWVMNFDGMRSMATTAWVVGAVALLVGASDISMARHSHHGGGLAA
ncbi:MAG: SPW repeat protein [Aeromicrobium sp.]